jgi:hypothetical protein
MRIQVLSDCHLECYRRIPKIEPFAELLILAGDIGKLHDQTFIDFINYASQNWKLIVFVAGNHEYYNAHYTYDELYQKYSEFFQQYDNVYFLEKDSIIYKNYKIMGLTMWAPFNGIKRLSCPNKIKTYITHGSEKRKAKIGIDGLNKIHESSVNWFTKNYDPTKPTILITHYPITNDLRAQPERYWKESENGFEGFASNITIPPIAQSLICVSGHTHQSHDFILNNVRFISNQLGYPDEARKNYTSFNEDCLFTIPDMK